MNNNKFSEISSSNSSQKNNREEIFKIFKQIDDDACIANPGLILTTPMLAKVLSIYNVYQKISTIPGDILEFGVWYGQNLILMENLRSIFEPFNIQRRFFGFDTFNGYPQDDSTGFGGQYSLKSNDFNRIKELISLHQQSNTPSHITDKVKLIEGDIKNTIKQLESKNISLVLLDISDYQTCKIILQKIIPLLVKGGIILFDDLTNLNQSSVAELFNSYKEMFKLTNCPFFPTRTIAIKL